MSIERSAWMRQVIESGPNQPGSASVANASSGRLRPWSGQRTRAASPTRWRAGAVTTPATVPTVRAMGAGTAGIARVRLLRVALGPRPRTG